MGILRVDKLSGLETPTAVTGSVAFDGTGDFVTTNFGVHIADSWTMEFWYNTSVNDATMRPMNFSSDLSGSNFVYIELGSSGTIKARVHGAAAFGSVHAPPVNQWHHTALSYDGSTAYFVLNGQLIASQSVSYTNHLAQVRFGADESNTSSNVYTGSISNARLVSGEALYTTDYTVPTHAFEVTEGTQILCFNNPDSVIATSNAGIGTVFPLTASGDPTASSDSPPITRDLTYGTEFKGVTTFDTQGYFVPPSGTTTDRDRTGGRALSGGGSQPGNTNAIEYFSITSQGNTFVFGDLTESRRGVGACASSTRGIFAGGGGSPNPAFTNTIEFVTISSEGNSVSFGDLDDPRRNIEGLSSQTRGVFSGGSKPAIDNVIEFITIASLGDAQNFGDLQAGEDRVFLTTAESTTRGLFAGGYGGPSPLNGVNTIGYITIASTGDAQNFGDLFTGSYSNAGTSSNTRAVFAGGADGPGAGDMQNVIEYVTIATLGNAQDFGDLTGANENIRGTSNKVRGVFAGGYQPGFTNTMQYITISSTGNAQDFGDLMSAISQQGMCSDSHGGLS